MSREEVYRDIEEHFGFVPSFAKSLPDDTIEHDWAIFKALCFEEGKLGLKEKNLIGLGVSGAIKCRYCALYHTEMAKMHGATDDEINEALRFAMDTTGWSTFLNGLQVDYDQFKDEMLRIKDYVSKKAEKREVERVAI
ncbi:MAG: carboxymuconolactone decarboxylase family protein [Armatimonadetes bacterium]|nr:carboxymuconolactone decarboxylase family protein [Armatimonadota bacterium]